ncbi:MAG: NUDIX domain-containing protein [Chlamydiota bacterium]
MNPQAVYGIIFSENKKEVLLVQRRDLPVWVLPGGGLDLKETPAEGAIREVEEETGYQVKVVRQVAEYLPVNRLTQKTYFFECMITGGAATLNSEAKNIRYFPVTSLPSTLPPPFPLWIADALSENQEVLVKKIEGVTYLTFFKLLFKHPILVLRYLLTKLGIRFNDKT